MKRPASIITGSVLCLVLSVAACEQSRGTVDPKGREDMPLPGVVPAPRGQPGGELAARAETPSASDPGCQTPREALGSVRRTVREASVEHLTGAGAANFVTHFNATNGGSVSADDVVVVKSPTYGETAVAIFSIHNCVLHTEAFTPANPNHE